MRTSKGNPTNMGVTKLNNGYNFSVAADAPVTLWLYPPKGMGTKPVSIELDDTCRMGRVYSVLVEEELTGWSYDYSCKEEHFTDPYGKSVSNVKEFGKYTDEIHTSLVELPAYDWQDDTKVDVSYADSIIYKIHPRGFTRHSSSKVKHKGTFAGITEKIPYLQELGITTLMLMPCYEFDETGRRCCKDDRGIPVYAQDYPLNYWGYTQANYFAVKSAYCASDENSGSLEFKEMVSRLHKAGIQVMMEMFFDKTTPALVLDCVKYWVQEYHIDGIGYYGDTASLNALINEPALADTRILNYGCDSNPYGNVAVYNEGFMNVARRFLKGDEDQLGDFMRNVIYGCDNMARVNYITNHNGFTLMDLVSYEYKHNEANGEGNRDGESYNYSWNCGCEGATAKKKVTALRISQMKNAWMMLLLCQGIPMILGGDEFCNSQKGNNNPYCQDNEIGWVNWNVNAMAREMTAFVKELITFRKNNKILHMDKPMLQSDYLTCGFPDVSYHGDDAWILAVENYKRYAGVLYCSEYCESKENQLIYVGYNMHWEAHELALPKGRTMCTWKVVTQSLQGEEIVFAEDGRQMKVPARSIVVLVGKSEQAATVTRKNKKGQKK